MNKFDETASLSQGAYQMLTTHVAYQKRLLTTRLRFSGLFSACVASNISVFDSVKTSNAKEDIDKLVQEILALNKKQAFTQPKKRIRLFEEFFN